MSTPAKFALCISLAAGIFVAGYIANRQPGPAVSSASSRQVLYYSCPMHPQYRSDHPGDAPCCGMRLEPVYAGDSAEAKSAAAAGLQGLVQVSSARQQLIGVRTDEVQRAPASQPIRLTGRIAVDEARLYRIIAAEGGWVRRLGSNPAGTFVKRDEILASYYVPNFQAAQLTFFTSTSAQLTRAEAQIGAQRPAVSLSLQVAIDALRNLGVNDLQIEELRQTRKYATEIHIYSPVTGFVLARNVSPEQRFDKGSELYRIADLRHVWVITDLFEKDRELVRQGAMATIRYQGREFRARASDALPQFDLQSRTLKTRLELDNPGNLFLPDMFVDVELHVDMPATLAVPAEAVIDSGRRKVVYVQRANAAFEPRLVETGWRLGDRVQITSGLEPGERIVVSGHFLIDSESRMEVSARSPVSAPEKIVAAKDLVCGMDVDPRSPNTLKIQHGGEAYYFCAELCKKSFEANPGKYVHHMMAAQDTTGAHMQE